MRKILKKMRDEKGSITSVVLVTVLFFIIILSTALMISGTQRKSQLDSEITLKQVYQNQVDDAENIDDKLYVATTVDGVTIPAGFVYVGGTKDSGLVISDNSADKEKYKGQETVGTDLEGNQFVWIPVENIADYKRTAYAYDGDTGTIDTSTNSTKISNYSSSSSNYYTEAMPSDEKESVEQNKGYYIGRYEAGDKESTEAKTLRSSGASTSNTITIKAKQAPYNYVTRTQAKTLAEGFGTKQNYKNVKTKLVSSYAWDTAIAFIQKTNSDYGSSSPQGNYKDSPTFTYTGIADTEKNKQTKANGTSTLIPTGQTTAVNNIYDMGGNVYEWTTESFSGAISSRTYRGGNCSCSFASDPAGRRGNYTDGAYGYIGVRLTLFL